MEMQQQSYNPNADPFNYFVIPPSLHHGQDCILYLNRGDHVVKEYPVGPNRKFSVVALDFDGTICNSEKAGFYDQMWTRFYQEMGVEMEPGDILDLHKKIYKWENTLPNSCAAAITRARQGISIDDTNLSENEAMTISSIFDTDRLIQKAKELDLDPEKQPHELVADIKEIITKTAFLDDPKLVLELAPFIDGALEFIKNLKKNGVLVFIFTGSRIDTTISPILEAYARLGIDLRDEFDAIVGEEMIPNKTHKGTWAYYQQAMFEGAKQAKANNRLAGGRKYNFLDWVYIGNPIGDKGGPDISAQRIHSFISFGGDNNGGKGYGPLTATIGGFHDLLQADPRDPNPVLSRMAATLKYNQ